MSFSFFSALLQPLFHPLVNFFVFLFLSTPRQPLFHSQPLLLSVYSQDYTFIWSLVGSYTCTDALILQRVLSSSFRLLRSRSVEPSLFLHLLPSLATICYATHQKDACYTCTKSSPRETTPVVPAFTPPSPPSLSTLLFVSVCGNVSFLLSICIEIHSTRYNARSMWRHND